MTTSYTVKNATPSPIPPNTPLNLYEYNVATATFLAQPADATTLPSREAHCVTLGGLLPGQTGNALDIATSLANINTTAIAAASAAVYLGSAGAPFVPVAPSGGLSQQLGTVGVESPTVGTIAFDVSAKAADAALISHIVNAPALARYANGGLTPGPLVTMVLPIPDHATGNVDFVNGSQEFVVTDAAFQNTGANGSNANTIQVDNGTGGNHITDAISANAAAAGKILRAGTIDTTHGIVAAGATLRVAQTRAGGVLSGNVVLTGYLSVE